MKLGLSLSLTAPRGAFMIESLFAGGIQGGYWNVSDSNSLWQDTGATVPVTAAGQTVARVDDKSGNGRHMVQASATQRPVYQLSGGKGRLVFDGVDDFLATGTGVTSALPYFMATAIDRKSVTTARGFMSFYQSGTEYCRLMGVSTSNRILHDLRDTSAGVASAASANNTAALGTHVLETYDTVGNCDYAVDGNAQTSFANAWIAATDIANGMLVIGQSSAGTTENHDWAGGVIVLGRTMSAGDRAGVRAALQGLL